MELPSHVREMPSDDPTVCVVEIFASAYVRHDPSFDIWFGSGASSLTGLCFRQEDLIVGFRTHMLGERHASLVPCVLIRNCSQTLNVANEFQSTVWFLNSCVDVLVVNPLSRGSISSLNSRKPFTLQPTPKSCMFSE